MMVGVHIFGTLALAAAEVGDADTLAGLLAYADRHMHPTWKNGGLLYPRNDDLSSDGYTTALIGNALLAGARLCPRDGFWSLYNKPWTADEIDRPELVDVDFPAVVVREAGYGDDGGSLAVTLAASDPAGCRAQISILRLDPSAVHRVRFDDGLSLLVGGDDPSAEAGDVAAAFDPASGKLRLSIPLTPERRFVVEPRDA